MSAPVRSVGDAGEGGGIPTRGEGEGGEGERGRWGRVPTSERRGGRGREGRRPRMLSRPCNAALRPPLTQFRGARSGSRAVVVGGRPPPHPTPEAKPGKPGTRCAEGAGPAFWGEAAGPAPPHHTFPQGCPRAQGATQALGKGLPEVTQEGAGGEPGISLRVPGGSQVRPHLLTCHLSLSPLQR